MERVYAGMIVADARGQVGTVRGVDQAGQLIVARDDGTQLTLGPHMYVVEGETVRMRAWAEANQASAVSTVGSEHTELRAGEELVVPVAQEEVIVRKRIVERGGVRIEKRVNEYVEEIAQPVAEEQVEVERVPIGRIVERVPEVREEGETLIIPVLEEQVVVTTRLVLKEEVRITRRRTEREVREEVVRREEQVTVHRLDDPTNLDAREATS